MAFILEFSAVDAPCSHELYMETQRQRDLRKVGMHRGVQDAVIAVAGFPPLRVRPKAVILSWMYTRRGKLYFEPWARCPSVLTFLGEFPPSGRLFICTSKQFSKKYFAPLSNRKTKIATASDVERVLLAYFPLLSLSILCRNG